MIETYTGEFKIKNEVGKNLLETYEVNGRKYTDNIPSDFIIGISKKEFIEYQQQKEKIERLNNIIKRFEEDLREVYLTFGEFSEEYTEKKIRELKGDDKE